MPSNTKQQKSTNKCYVSSISIKAATDQQHSTTKLIRHSSFFSTKHNNTIRLQDVVALQTILCQRKSIPAVLNSERPAPLKTKKMTKHPSLTNR